MKYLIIWLVSFIAISAVDALWHLVIFRKRYAAEFKKVAEIKNGKVIIKPVPGILSQIAVVTSIMMITLLAYNLGATTLITAVLGAFAGILAISVYGLVNYSLIKDWSADITLLEVIWGPIIGTFSGLLIVYLYNIL